MNAKNAGASGRQGKVFFLLRHCCPVAACARPPWSAAWLTVCPFLSVIRMHWSFALPSSLLKNSTVQRHPSWGPMLLRGVMDTWSGFLVPPSWTTRSALDTVLPAGSKKAWSGPCIVPFCGRPSSVREHDFPFLDSGLIVEPNGEPNSEYSFSGRTCSQSGPDDLPFR